ncbi:hypothetical protein AB0A05_38110 [Streptomyces sp. NPDC046374]|uniref:hypothetical protein n=1 Tax=Streptomyces sp. NPDC046374 TaxID=3154917 RepID=UPI003410534C
MVRRARAYLLLDGHLCLLTERHNARRAYDGDRNLITACLVEPAATRRPSPANRP